MSFTSYPLTAALLAPALEGCWTFCAMKANPLVPRIIAAPTGMASLFIFRFIIKVLSSDAVPPRRLEVPFR